jgi:hypothetical protein
MWNANSSLCPLETCRHYTIYLPPNKCLFDGKTKKLGGKSAAYTYSQ